MQGILALAVRKSPANALKRLPDIAGSFPNLPALPGHFRIRARKRPQTPQHTEKLRRPPAIERVAVSVRFPVAAARQDLLGVIADQSVALKSDTGIGAIRSPIQAHKPVGADLRKRERDILGPALQELARLGQGVHVGRVSRVQVPSGLQRLIHREPFIELTLQVLLRIRARSGRDGLAHWRSGGICAVCLDHTP